MEYLKQRRSIRGFDPNYKLTKDEMQKIVEACRLSPTACNLQEINLTIVTNKEKIQKIDSVRKFHEGSLASLKKWQERNIGAKSKSLITYDCSALFLMTINERELKPYAPIDAGILSMSIMVVAEQLGLGSCCLGVLIHPEIEELFGFKKGSLVMALAVGKPISRKHVPKEDKMNIKFLD